MFFVMQIYAAKIFDENNVDLKICCGHVCNYFTRENFLRSQRYRVLTEAIFSKTRTYIVEVCQKAEFFLYFLKYQTT